MPIRYEPSPGTGGGGGAPVDAEYVVLSLNGTLTQERVLTQTANQVLVTDNGAGGTVVLSTPQDIHTAATPTFQDLTLANAAATSTLTFDNDTATNTSGLINAFADRPNTGQVILELRGNNGGQTATSNIVLERGTADNSGQIEFYTKNAGAQAVRLKIAQDGAITFNTAYTFPTSDGSANQVLTTNGAGTVSFQDVNVQESANRHLIMALMGA